MQYDDFCALSSDEFRAVYKQWDEMREAESQERWEQVRLHAAIVIQPHSKKKVEPGKILKFPWDGKKKKRGGSSQPSKEESKKRFEAIMARVKTTEA